MIFWDLNAILTTLQGTEATSIPPYTQTEEQQGPNVLHQLTDVLIQSDLQEQLGLSALLKGTSADCFSPPSQPGDSNQQPFSYRTAEWRSGLRHYISVLEGSLQTLVRSRAVSQGIP